MFKFSGVPRFRKFETWYDRTTFEPWSEEKIHWLFQNKYRRMIVEVLSKGPRSEEELFEALVVRKEPLLADPSKVKVSLRVPMEALKSHLDSMEKLRVILKGEDGKYRLNIVLLNREEVEELERIAEDVAEKTALEISKHKGELEALSSDKNDRLREIIDPLLEKVGFKAIERISPHYQWERFARWVEEVDLNELKKLPSSRKNREKSIKKD
ncbi:MAG: hypothetical protein ACFE68_02420 [Candidatus Hodarchaeota archaeon]